MSIEMEEKVKARFLKDVEGHSMRVLYDSGLFRHLRFDNNGSSIHHFNVTTFPGYLAITGDMGDFVFKRLKDMFCFFRREKLEINAGYWAGKAVSISRHGGLSEFDLDLFRSTTAEIIAEYYKGDPEKQAACLQSFEDEVLSDSDENDERELRWLAGEFDFEGFRFEELYEYSFSKFTYQFLWCLHAIVWGIQKYDAVKSADRTAEAGSRSDANASV